MSIRLLVLKETAAGEMRVAMDPATVKKLTDQKVNVSIISEAGSHAGFPDRAYGDATVLAEAEATSDSPQIICWVQIPDQATIKRLPKGCVVIGQVFAQRHPEQVEALCEQELSLIHI